MQNTAQRSELKSSLLSKCDETAFLYSDALTHLRQQMSTATSRESGDLYSKSEYARMDMERARLEYQQHAAEHGCYVRWSYTSCAGLI